MNMKNNKNQIIQTERMVKINVEPSDILRQNILKYAEEKGMTIVDVANESDIPINTLNSFMHRVANDMKVSNAYKIAKAFGISVDELISADTLHELTIESLAMCRELPKNDLYLVRWFIRYLHALNTKAEPNKRYISVIIPEITNDGDFKITSNYEKIEITEIEEPIRSKVFAGCEITCDYFMPHYIPGDVILIANDRPPKPNENAIVRVDKYLFVAKRKIENGIAKYYSIRDGKYRIDESEVDELIGYVAYVMNR